MSDIIVNEQVPKVSLASEQTTSDSNIPVEDLTLQVEEAIEIGTQGIYTKQEKKELIGKLLHRMVSSGDDTSVLQLFRNDILKEYIDINVLDEDGSPPLIYAACFGYFEVAEVLVKNGASLDLQDKNGWPALMWAMSNQHEKIVKLLLDHGASPGARTTKGRTVLDIINHGLNNTNENEKSVKLQEILSYNHQHRVRQSIQSFSGFNVNDYLDDDSASFKSLPLTDPEGNDKDYLIKINDKFNQLELLGNNLENIHNSDNYGYHEDTLEELTVEEFVWDQCLPDQMFVFSNQQIPHILTTIITTMNPNHSKEQRFVPSNVLFLCSRFAFYFSTPDLLQDLLKSALKLIADCVKLKFNELKYLSFWLANCSQLLYYLKKDSGLVSSTVEHQLALSELIHEIYQLLVRNIQSKLESELESCILECESIPGLNDESKFKEKRKSFLSSITSSFNDDDEKLANGLTPLRKRLSIRRRINNNNNQNNKNNILNKKDSNPEKITSILSSALAILHSYQVHVILIHHILNQLIYYITSELFNRILDTKKYCSRTRAIQIRMSVTVLEEWIRTHATSPIVANLSSHFKSLLHLLQFLQCYSSHKSLAEFIETLQTLDTISPLQIQLIAETYRYENEEDNVPEEILAYIQQVADRVIERRHKNKDNKNGKSIVVVRDLEDEVTSRISRRVSFLDPEKVPLPLSRTDSPKPDSVLSSNSNTSINNTSGNENGNNGNNNNNNNNSQLKIQIVPPSNEHSPIPKVNIITEEEWEENQLNHTTTTTVSNNINKPLPVIPLSHSRENSNELMNSFVQYNLFTLFKDPNHLLPFSVPTHSDMNHSWNFDHSKCDNEGNNEEENVTHANQIPNIPEQIVELLNG
ncbi:hypothetical protein K502DRAFT_363859 [Neoconidiobolus thromboides FSU 785]|nr:hypothetical protein K502DRAFT_363859 [Neoconidiobolus thromboides FSU 785]